MCQYFPHNRPLCGLAFMLFSFSCVAVLFGRGHREVQSYVREVETEERRLRDFQESGQDASKIRQQEQVVAESRDMISFTRNKLATGVEQLRKELVR